jgi:hypothetical protein
VGCWLVEDPRSIEKTVLLGRAGVVANLDALSKCCIAGKIGSRLFVVVVVFDPLDVWLVRKGRRSRELLFGCWCGMATVLVESVVCCD